MSWYCQDFGDAGCPDTASGTGSINAVVYLPAGSHVVFTAIGTVSASATGTLSNTANVYSVLPDPNPTNDSATDMDTVVLPTLAVNDVTITEGNAGTSIASFTVTLSPAPPAPVTVNYSTQDVTAQAGSDYVFASGMLTFGIGETSKPIEVTVNGDTQYEPAETLEVVLEVVTSPSSATIGDGTGVLTISNDDTPAGPSRVFVSVLGADTNDCSNIATPCRTLNGAIAQVAEDGEVIVIKSGSYAGATITKGVKIDVASGVVAFSGQTVTVNALFAKVVIRGLTLKALNPGTGFGLLIEAAGAVFVESTVLDGWEVGLRQVGAAELFVKDSMLRNNGLALFAGSGKTSVDSTRFLNNVTGVYAEDSELSLRGSTLSGASSAGVWAGDSSAVVVEKCQISDNASGIYVASTATVGLSRSAVIGNGLGLENAGGTLLVYGNNAVRANATNISGPITPAGLQ
jgi:hypothetical protein